jgi:lipopolysaccharide assembly outer membrane protein LptD (OstA)
MRLRPELLLAATLAACGHAPAPPPAATPSAGPAATVVPVHVTSSGNGRYTTLSEMKHRRTIYVVRARSFVADTAAGESTAGSGAFDQPEITFIDRNGARTVADAPKAVLTSADKSVLMTGGVRARSQDGNVLACDELRYDGNTERIHGFGHVVLQTPAGLTLVGDDVDGDARLQNVRVYRR